MSYGVKTICEISSIFNIDVTSSLYYYNFLKGDCKIIIIFNDSSLIPNEKEYRKYVSRHAIPRYKHVLRKDGNWNNLFEGIGNSNSSQVIDLVKIYMLDILNVLNPKKDKELILEIKSNYDKLFIEYYKKNSESNEINQYKKLIETILKLIIPSAKIKVLDSNTINSNLEYRKHRIKTFLKIACNTRENSINDLNHGGKITVFKSDKKIGTFNRISNHKYVYELSNNSEKEYIPISERQLFSDDFDFKFHGQLHNLFLQQLGRLTDAPYYLKVNKSNFKSEREFISPISVSDISRVSLSMKGEGNRLNPSGYSIIEMKDIRVLKLLNGHFNDDKINFNNIDDWLFLINNYPLSKEKLSNYQGSIKQYIALREKTIRIKLRQNKRPFNIEFDKIVKNNLPISHVGIVLLNLWAIINFSRETVYPFNNINSQYSIKELMKIKNTFNYSDIDVIEIILNRCLNLIKSCILHNCDDDAKMKFDMIKNEILITLKEIEINNVKLQKPKTKKEYYKFKSIAKLNRFIKEIIVFYYTYTAFTISSSFKSHSLLLYLMFGKDCMVQIDNIQNLRKNKFISYTPKYLK